MHSPVSASQVVLCIAAIFTGLEALANICPYDVKECRCDRDHLICTGLQTIPHLYTQPDAAKISWLELIDGNITSVPTGSLPPGLSQLSFTGHPLTTISDNAFDTSAWTLRFLKIMGAKLKQLPKALLGVNNLESLLISNTPIYVWDETITQHLANSTLHIELSIMNLTVTPKWISSCDHLATLILKYNNITTIPAFLANISSLDILDLSYNDIAWIERDSFPLDLHQLDLSGNELTKITDTFFANLKNLSVLTLSYNPIVTISAKAFSDLPSLSSLLLYGTNLREIPTAIPFLSTDITIGFGSLNSVNCPCPGPNQHIDWSSLHNKRIIVGDCTSNQTIYSYLASGCEDKPAPTTTTSVLTTAVTNTTTKGDATTLQPYIVVWLTPFCVLWCWFCYIDIHRLKSRLE